MVKTTFQKLDKKRKGFTLILNDTEFGSSALGRTYLLSNDSDHGFSTLCWLYLGFSFSMPALPLDDEGTHGHTTSTHEERHLEQTIGSKRWGSNTPEDFAAGRRLAFSLTRRFVVGCETLLRSPRPLGRFPTF